MRFGLLSIFSYLQAFCDLVVDVSNADYAGCSGRYERTSAQLRERPVYKHASRARYLFWSGDPYGWAIGAYEGWTRGGWFHYQGKATFASTNTSSSEARLCSDTSGNSTLLHFSVAHPFTACPPTGLLARSCRSKMRQCATSAGVRA